MEKKIKKYKSIYKEAKNSTFDIIFQSKNDKNDFIKDYEGEIKIISDKYDKKSNQWYIRIETEPGYLNYRFTDDVEKNYNGAIS